MLDYGQHRQSNIDVRGKFGKDRFRDPRYYRTCGKRYAATRVGALFGMRLPAAGTIRQLFTMRRKKRCAWQVHGR
jgi:hypothetical protein